MSRTVVLNLPDEGPGVRKTRTNTKWNIFVAAVELFAERGVDGVSMRELAQAVGVRASSIYAHFESKDMLCEEMFQFYEKNYSDRYIDLDAIMEQIGKVPAVEVLGQLTLHYDPDYELIMSQIMKIALSRMHTDIRAHRLIHDVFYTRTERTLRRILQRLIDTGGIKPVPIDTFIGIYRCMCLQSSLLMNTSDEISKSEWVKMTNLLYSMISNDAQEQLQEA